MERPTDYWAQFGAKEACILEYLRYKNIILPVLSPEVLDDAKYDPSSHEGPNVVLRREHALQIGMITVAGKIKGPTADIPIEYLINPRLN